MTRRDDDARRMAFDARTADSNLFERTIWGFTMYGRFDGPHASDEDEDTAFPRVSFWERLGIGQLVLGQEPQWRKDRDR